MARTQKVGGMLCPGWHRGGDDLHRCWPIVKARPACCSTVNRRIGNKRPAKLTAKARQAGCANASLAMRAGSRSSQGACIGFRLSNSSPQQSRCLQNQLSGQNVAVIHPTAQIEDGALIGK